MEKRTRGFYVNFPLKFISEKLWKIVLLMQKSTLGSWHFLQLHFFIMVVLGLRCCVQAFSSWGKRGLLFVAMQRLLVVVASCCGVWALGTEASIVCGAQTWLPHHMWNLPRPGIELMSRVCRHIPIHCTTREVHGTFLKGRNRQLV